MYANKLVSTRRAIGNKNTCHSQVMDPGVSSDPADPDKHFHFTALWWRGLATLLSQCVSLIDVGRDPSAYVDFLFFLCLAYAGKCKNNVHMASRCNSEQTQILAIKASNQKGLSARSWHVSICAREGLTFGKD
eukprot:526644-Pelagomonas_calceolata.AAC.1